MAVKCAECHSDNPQGMRSCGRCGARLEKACPQCGRPNPAESKFCSECGQHLVAVGTVSGPDYTQPHTYAPKHLADKILAARKSMEGERKQVTVFFADVTNFTSISERLDPEEVHGLIRKALVFITAEIHRYEGTIVQFLGDGVMALFGAPIAHEDDPQRALHSALAIRERAKEYARSLKEQGIDFDMHMGLNSGLVMVGSIGDDTTMEYTAMGDTVNLASRMASMAQSGSILVSENTQRLAKESFDFRPLGELQVKGKKDPVNAYELLGETGAKTRFGASVARGLTPFVGRKKELEKLLGCYQRMKTGHGQVVAIVGEAGVGKSRLLLQMRQMLPREDRAYLAGECYNYGEAIAYLPILHIIRSYFGIEEHETGPETRRKLIERIKRLGESFSNILPPLQEILSVQVEDEQYLKLAPQRKREKTFEAIASLLIRESRDRPVVVVVEDLHWMDETSEEFLDYLINRMAGDRIMLLLLYRPEFTHSWGTKTYFSQISLGELLRDASADMVQAMLREGRAAAELKDLVLTKTAGNPLFIEEFTRDLLEKGQIERKDDQYVLKVNPAETQAPQTVQGIIGARIDRLGDDLKETMQTASVIGMDFAIDTLRVVTGTKEELGTQLGELQALEFVYEKSTYPEPENSFRHVFIQEVAYGSLPLSKRRTIHQKVGQAIEESCADRLEEVYEVLVHHFDMGRDRHKTLEYSLKAGRKAKRVFAHKEAIAYYRKALKIGEEQPKNYGTRSEIEEDLGDIYELTGQYEEALTSYQSSQRCCEALKRQRDLKHVGEAINGAHGPTDTPKPEELNRRIATICGKKALVYERKGQYDAALHWLDSGLGMLPDNCLEKAHLSVDRAGVLYRQGSHADALKWCQRGLDMAQDSRDLGTEAHAYYLLGTIHADLGDIEQSVKYRQRSLSIYEQIQDLSGQAKVHNNLGVDYYYQGIWEQAVKHYQMSLEIMDRMGDVGGVATACNNLGEVLSDQGHLDEAIQLFNRALRTWQSTGYFLGVGLSESNLGRAYARLGNPQEALAHLRKASQLLQQIESKGFLAECWQRMAEAYLGLGDPRTALEHCQRSLSLAQKLGMNVVEGVTRRIVGQALHDLGEWQRAEESLNLSRGILEKKTVKHELAQTLWQMALLCCDMRLCEPAAVTTARIKGPLEESIAIFQTLGIGYDSAKAAEVRNYCISASD
jgi:class 3 adenylate cyclase/tetratricopeptide (TPR) repeat protein/energy-coupling factor transporter ATP-binding protein EcfA2